MARKDIIASIADDITEDISTNNGLTDGEEAQVFSEDIDTRQIAKKMKRNISIPEQAPRRRFPDFEPETRDWQFERHRQLPPPPRTPATPIVLPTDGSIRIVRGNNGRPTLSQPIERIMAKPVVESAARPVGKFGRRKLDI